jgi:hypothetical protein
MARVKPVLHEGQNVKVKMNAFPYTGRIDEILLRGKRGKLLKCHESSVIVWEVLVDGHIYFIFEDELYPDKTLERLVQQYSK